MNFYDNLKMFLIVDKKIIDIKIINDGDDFANYSNEGFVLSPNSKKTYNARVAKAKADAEAEWDSASANAAAGGSRRRARRPSRKYKKSKRVFRKKSRSTRRR
jgi:hypothetical protein